ncbi:MAG: RluA family pseudouridine synthase [Opitutales bacterium]|nr:RluA family pseudouridine synthase [Opitutales bacterium]
MTDTHFTEDAPLVDLDEFKTWILREDENFLILNKPGWLVCHPSKNGPLSSLVGAARLYLGESGALHLVSRLDRETSGIVALAKNKNSASLLQKAVEQKLVGKKYLAILRGRLEGSYTVCQPLADDRASSVVVKQCCAVDRGSAKHALTIVTPLRFSDKIVPLTLCRVEILTGRKHQIRAHAKWIGREIVGDKIYGADENIYLRFIEKGLSPEDMSLLLMPRQALHAWESDFSKAAANLKIRAPLPKDFSGFMLEYGLGGCEEFNA